MDPFVYIRKKVILAVELLSTDQGLPLICELPNITVEPPRDSSHGDVATNAALLLSKKANMDPRAIADFLIQPLSGATYVEKVEVAGPGFINFSLSKEFWLICLQEILSAGLAYGNSNLAAGEKINVEYVSANPTGPLHIGHVRGAVYGDALANLLERVGYDVCREYYINDAGTQVDHLARSLYLRYCEILGEEIVKIPPEFYPGEYLIPVGQAIVDSDGPKWLDSNEVEWLDHFRRLAVNAMMDLVKNDLSSLGIKQKVFFSEESLHKIGGIDDTLAALKEKNLIYTGTLEPPKGKAPDDWEPRPQTLFRSTSFGDDSDRPLKKSDGNWTYFAADIAYHHNKVERGFVNMVDVWGADHGGYIKRMKAAVSAITDNRGILDVRLCQMVRLIRGGKVVRMSKRSGNYITLRELVDEVGRDVVRFMMLSRKNDAPLDFDFNAALEQSKDNPVFYVQYAHARICSVLRRAAEDFPNFSQDLKSLAKIDFNFLDDSAEIVLIKQLACWPRTVEVAALAKEPHRIAIYLYQLASDFHALWNKGNTDPKLRFIVLKSRNVTMARLALISGVATILSSGLEIMGVKPAENM